MFARTKRMAIDAPLAFQLLLHNCLRGDASMVCAGHPQRVAAAHPVPPRQCVLPSADLSARHESADGSPGYMRMQCTVNRVR